MKVMQHIYSHIRSKQHVLFLLSSLIVATSFLSACSFFQSDSQISSNTNENSSDVSVENSIEINSSYENSSNSKNEAYNNVIENISIEKSDYAVLMDRIIISRNVPTTLEEVESPGSIEINQIVGNQHHKITEIVNVIPDQEVALTAMSATVLQGATYEVRMANPIIFKDGTQWAFHAYVISYQWERDQYLKTMSPSPHPLYLLSDGEEPDYLDLIASGLAESTSQDLIRNGDQLVTQEELNENSVNMENNISSSTNSISNSTANNMTYGGQANPHTNTTPSNTTT